MKKVSYEFLINELDENKRICEYAYEIEKTIPAPYYFSYQNPTNHILSFINNYIIEKSILDMFSPQLSFIEPDSHFYFHEGKGNNKADMEDEYGTTYEIKRCKNYLAFCGNKANLHNADYVLIYLIDTSELMLYDCDCKSSHVLGKLELFHKLYDLE